MEKHDNWWNSTDKYDKKYETLYKKINTLNAKQQEKQSLQQQSMN